MMGSSPQHQRRKEMSFPICPKMKGLLQNLQLVSCVHEALHQLMAEHALRP